MRSRRPSSFVGLLAHVVGHAGLVDLRAVLLDDRRVVLAQLARIDSICLRRKYSRCCFSAPDSTSSRICLRSCSSVSRSRWMLHGELEALGDVERLEQLAPSARRRGRGRSRSCRPARRARRSRAGTRRRGRRRRAARGSPRPRRGTRARASRVRPSTGTSSVCSSPRRGGGRRVGVGRAGDAAGDAGEGDRAAAAGQADAVGHAGDRADLGELALVARDEQDAAPRRPTSTGSVTSMVGKTTVSSRGMSSSEVI